MRIQKITGRNVGIHAFALGACLLLASSALAQPSGPSISVKEFENSTFGFLQVLYPGFDQNSLNVQVTTESVDLHAEYLDPALTSLTPGQAITINFNFFESPLSSELSDTANIVFTGHTPVPGQDENNVIVDFHFLSDTDRAALTALPDGISIPEVTGPMVLDSYLADRGITGFALSIESDLDPVPDSSSTLGLLLLSSTLVFGAARFRPASAS